MTPLSGVYVASMSHGAAVPIWEPLKINGICRKYLRHENRPLHMETTRKLLK